MLLQNNWNVHNMLYLFYLLEGSCCTIVLFTFLLLQCQMIPKMWLFLFIISLQYVFKFPTLWKQCYLLSDSSSSINTTLTPHEKMFLVLVPGCVVCLICKWHSAFFKHIYPVFSYKSINVLVKPRVTVFLYLITIPR